MGIHYLRSISATAKQVLKFQSSFIRNHHHHGSQQSPEVPKGHVAVYVGDQIEKTRFLVPVTFLNHPSFQGLLSRAEEEFGFSQPAGGLMIPCKEQAFVDILTSQLHS